MKYRSLLFCLSLLGCTSPDPTELLFTEYITPLLNDPASYEFVGVDSVSQYRLTWDEFVEARQSGVSKKEAYATDNGKDGFSDAWVTYRAKNKMGGVVTQRMYLQIENGKVISAKKWNEALPHERY